MLKQTKKLILLFLMTILIATLWIHPVKSQGFYLNNYLPNVTVNKSTLFKNDSKSQIKSGCIILDGRCQFKIGAPINELQQRIQIIDQRLKDISKIYFIEEEISLEVKIQEINNFKEIFIYLDNQEFRLMTVTNWDAEIDNTNVETKAEVIRSILDNNLKKAKKERETDFLIKQGIIATTVICFVFLLIILISGYEKRLKQKNEKLISEQIDTNQPITAQLTSRKKINIQEVQHRLLQLLKFSIFIAGLLLIFDLFPYTRFLQILVINLLRIPFKIAIVAIITYILIRLSYALINQLSSLILNDFSLTPISNERLELRVTTISSLARNIITITWLSIGFLFCLFLIGINIAPILAGLGIFSLALSLGSQNLIKDAINGFFIILEDQFAVGDVINVNDVGGLVENLNLRITQLRDAEGRLITIPNGEIKIVANLSSQWSRADLNIPISYKTDIQQSLNIIENVAMNMSKEEEWEEKIIDLPQILGVDKFDNHGLIIKVWIKTQPLKQWLVSREFRRRIVIAFSESGIPIPPPQKEIFLAENQNKESR